MKENLNHFKPSRRKLKLSFYKYFNNSIISRVGRFPTFLRLFRSVRSRKRTIVPPNYISKILTTTPSPNYFSKILETTPSPNYIFKILTTTASPNYILKILTTTHSPNYILKILTTTPSPNYISKILTTITVMQPLIKLDLRFY